MEKGAVTENERGIYNCMRQKAHLHLLTLISRCGSSAPIVRLGRLSKDVIKR